MDEAEAWALTAPVQNDLQRSLLLALAADAVDRAAYFDPGHFAQIKRYDRSRVLSELKALEEAGVVIHTRAYQPFDVWILHFDYDFEDAKAALAARPAETLARPDRPVAENSRAVAAPGAHVSVPLEAPTPDVSRAAEASPKPKPSAGLTDAERQALRQRLLPLEPQTRT